MKSNPKLHAAGRKQLPTLAWFQISRNYSQQLATTCGVCKLQCRLLLEQLLWLPLNWLILRQKQTWTCLGLPSAPLLSLSTLSPQSVRAEGQTLAS